MRDGVRFVEGGELTQLVDAETQQDVLGYLARTSPSCHSDTGEALLRAAEPCGDCIAFSPSFAGFRYVALLTRRRIFALGLGQFSVCFRLPGSLHAAALQAGAAAAPEIGRGWVRFDLFQPDRPEVDLPSWTLRACAATRGQS